MRVVVTGGAGFIGSHTVDWLLQANHEVFVLDNLSRGHLAWVPSQAHLDVLDIAQHQVEPTMARIRPEAVIHLAAQMDVRYSVQAPLDDANTNILGTLRVAQAALASGCRRFVFASTGGAIYGDHGIPQGGTPEHTPCHPQSPYGLSKWCAEHYLNYLREHLGGTMTILRFGNVYGPRQDPHGEAGVVAIFCELLRQQRPVTIFGDGQQTRDFIYVDDVVASLAQAIGLPQGHRGGIFNIGTGQEVSVFSLYQQLSQIAGGTYVEPIWQPARPGEQQRSCLAIGAAQAHLNWRPQVSLTQGLQATWQWLGEHQLERKIHKRDSLSPSRPEQTAS